MVVHLDEVADSFPYIFDRPEDSAVDRLLLECSIPAFRDSVGLRLRDKREAVRDAPVANLFDEVVGRVLAPVVHPEREAACHILADGPEDPVQALGDRLEGGKAITAFADVPPDALCVVVLDRSENPAPALLCRLHAHAVGAPGGGPQSLSNAPLKLPNDAKNDPLFAALPCDRLRRYAVQSNKRLDATASRSTGGEMPKVKRVEKQIWDLEGFAVTIRYEDGRDVRGDRKGLPSYSHLERAAKNSMTVAQWKDQRFRDRYPGFDVDVLDGDGEAAHGGTLLGTVRDSYDDDE